MIVQDCRRRKRPLPDKVANAPQLLTGLDIYWDAYVALSTCRPPAFAGVMPIPWASVDAYARAQDFDEEQHYRLWYCVSMMDKEFTRYVKSKEERGPEPKPKRVR